MVSCSSAHRHCSLRVRIQRSAAQPLVSGSPRKAASSVNDREAVDRRLPRSSIGPLQRHYNVYRIVLVKSTARLRHPQVDSTRQEAERVAARAGASKFPPDLGVGLAARSDRDPGWSPWPTLCLQTRMTASTATRATSPAGHLPAR
jgi:hypothetical protein